MKFKPKDIQADGVPGNLQLWKEIIHFWNEAKSCASAGLLLQGGVAQITLTTIFYNLSI